MTTRRPVAVCFALLALLPVSMVLRTPALLTAQTSNGQSRPSGVPYREPNPPAVLALDGNGGPLAVSQANPVPVHVSTPVPITTTTPLVVNDGGQVITATGNYTFVFPNEVTLPGLGGKVDSVAVSVSQIAGKWVTATYAGSTIGQRAQQITLVFNTEQLLAVAQSR